MDKYTSSKNYEYARIRVSNMLKNKSKPEEMVEKLKNTTYINNRIINKRIKKDVLQEYLNSGWNKGRIKYKRQSPTEETRKRIGDGNRGKKCSEHVRLMHIKYHAENPQCWISKENNSKQIFLKDLEIYLNKGWVRGRLCNSKINFDTMSFIKSDNFINM